MKLNRISLLGSVTAMILIGAFAPIEPANASTGKEPAASGQTSGPHQDPSHVIVPEVPQSVTFAGKEISLDPIDMWERMDRELTAMSYTHGNTLLAIKRANRYFPVMAPILKEHR